jgi:ComF family protein
MALDLALPPRCPACGTVTVADHLFCVDCWQKLDFLNGPACGSCGEPFAVDPGPGARCGACLADPPAIDGMSAAVAYGDIARALALKLKYGGRPGIATTLARQMRRLLQDEDVLLTPVPLHRWRLWRRGYNQAALITRALARETGHAFSTDLLLRTRATPVLRGMGPGDRRKAVRGAFRVAPNQIEAVRNRAVVLIDDVYTTGATANACATALKRAGAASVGVCCWSRVIRDIDNGVPG